MMKDNVVGVKDQQKDTMSEGRGRLYIEMRRI